MYFRLIKVISHTFQPHTFQPKPACVLKKNFGVLDDPFNNFREEKQKAFCEKRKAIEDIKPLSFLHQIGSQLNKVMHLTFNQRVSIIYHQLLKHEPVFTPPNNSPKARLPMMSKVARLNKIAISEPCSLAA